MGKRGDLCCVIVTKVEALLATNQFTLRDIATQCEIHHRSVVRIKKKLYANKVRNRFGICGGKKISETYDNLSNLAPAAIVYVL